MFSEKERDALAGIERELTAADPRLARRLRRRRVPRVPGGRAAGLAVLGVLLAVGLMVLGLVGQALLVLAVLSAPLFLRYLGRRPRGGGRDRPA